MHDSLAVTGAHHHPKLAVGIGCADAISGTQCQELIYAYDHAAAVAADWKEHTSRTVYARKYAQSGQQIAGRLLQEIRCVADLPEAVVLAGWKHADILKNIMVNCKNLSFDLAHSHV